VCIRLCWINCTNQHSEVKQQQCILLDLLAKCNGFIATNEELHNAYELCIEKDV
jgi:hypothetical protein